jgi:Ni/Fe-hydrogenase subunit HybB-like protein
MNIADTRRFWEILVIAVLQILEDSGKYWLYQYCRYWKILENIGYTSIADTGGFWKILVIPLLQILEDSGKYWLYQYCRYWKIRYEFAECTCILVFFCPFCASVMRRRTMYRETGRKETKLCVIVFHKVAV